MKSKWNVLKDLTVRVLFGAWLLLCSLQGFAQTNTNSAVVTVTGTNNVTEVTTRIVAKEDSYLTFGLNKVEPLRQLLFGVPLWQYLASLIYIILAVMTARFINYIVCVRLKKWAATTETKYDDYLIELLHGPIKIVALVIFLHIGLQAFNWPPIVEMWLSRGLKVIVAISLTYFVLKFIDLFLRTWRDRITTRDGKNFNDQLFPLISKALKGFVIMVALLVTSDNLGLNIRSVIASLSIGGLALGLAAQDTVANLFGAFAVFVDKPFKIGDMIKLEAVQGTVETIGLRSTRIRNLDGFLVTIPNKTMGNATITNITRRPNIKTEMNLTLAQNSSHQKIQEAVRIIEEVYRQNPMTTDLLVAFNRFNDTSLNINIVHFWGALDNKAYLKGLQEMNIELKRRFDEAKISFASPSQTVYLRQDSDWKLLNAPSENLPPKV